MIFAEWISPYFIWRQHRWWRWQRRKKNKKILIIELVPAYRGTDTVCMVFALHTVGGRWTKRVSVLPPNTELRNPSRYFVWTTSTKGARLRPLLFALERKVTIKNRVINLLSTDRITFCAVLALHPNESFEQIIERIAHIIFYTSPDIASSTIYTRAVRLLIYCRLSFHSSLTVNTSQRGQF